VESNKVKVLELTVVAVVARGGLATYAGGLGPSGTTASGSAVRRRARHTKEKVDQ
jgi:hypothetical protein